MLTVSVVIPTYNRLDRLKRVIACLEAQDHPLSDFEVIVAADGCNDGTLEYLDTVDTPLRLMRVTGENGGAGAARNRGLAKACGRLVLFIDDDVLPEPDLISQHVRTHQELGPGFAVLGPMLTPPDARLLPWVRWEQVRLERQYRDMVEGRWQATARQFYTGNTSLARELVRAVGGFDTRFRRAEDVELAYRLAATGVRFVFNPRAVGHHYAERSFRSWLDAAYAYGRSDVVFGRDLGQAWLLPRLAHEFQRNRHPLVRGAVRLCVGRPRLGRAAIGAMRATALVASRLGSEAVADLACSGMFNLQHYQGIADELGGRAAFFEAMARAAETPVPGAFVGGAADAQTVNGSAVASRDTLPEAK